LRNWPAVQQAHAVDAAARRQDRGVFEMENRPEGSTDLLVAAQLMGRPLGGGFSHPVNIATSANHSTDRPARINSQDAVQ